MKRIVLLLLFGLTVAFQPVPKAPILKNEGDNAFKTKQYALALAKYEQALAVWGKAPQDNAMLYNLGVCAYSVKDMKKSLKYIDMCIAAGYNLDMSYQYRGCIMQANNDQQGYLKTIQEGLAKVPQSKALKQTLSKYYFEEGDKFYHAGMDLMKKVAEQVKAGKVSSSDAAFREQNARAKAQFEEAIKWMNKSLEVNPDDANAKTIRNNCQNQVKMLI